MWWVRRCGVWLWYSRRRVVAGRARGARRGAGGRGAAVEGGRARGAAPPPPATNTTLAPDTTTNRDPSLLSPAPLPPISRDDRGTFRSIPFSTGMECTRPLVLQKPPHWLRQPKSLDTWNLAKWQVVKRRFLIFLLIAFFLKYWPKGYDSKQKWLSVYLINDKWINNLYSNISNPIVTLKFWNNTILIKLSIPTLSIHQTVLIKFTRAVRKIQSVKKVAANFINIMSLHSNTTPYLQDKKTWWRVKVKTSKSVAECTWM